MDIEGPKYRDSNFICIYVLRFRPVCDEAGPVEWHLWKIMQYLVSHQRIKIFKMCNLYM